MTTTERRYCIIGAGYVGNGVARAFKQAGIAYDQLEATDHIGGNWAHGVYDSTHLISSRASTAYAGFPMPAHYPDFPSRAQMLAYLESFVDHYGLREHIEFNTEVVGCRPLDAHGLTGWRVELAGGEVREYAGVVVVNGHDWKMRRPTYPGTFVGQQLHSKQYQGPADLDGDRVLVVGAGNSACDVAVETALTRGGCDISMRSGAWFSPKLFAGVPVAEWDRLWLPKPVTRMVAGWEKGPIASLDAGVEDGDLGADAVAVVEHHLQDHRVVRGEESAQRLFEPVGLLACAGLGQPGQRARIALAGDQGVHDRPPGDAVRVRQHRRDLDLGVLEQLFDPLLLAGAVLHQGAPVAGEIAQPTDLGRLHSEGRHMPRSATFASQDASARSVFAGPGTFLTSRALTSQQSNPSASNR